MIELLLLLSALALVIVASEIIIGATIDDLRDVRRRSLFKAHPYARRYQVRPVVTVLLVTGTGTIAAERALRQLRKNTYRRIEIIIVSRVRRAKLQRLAKRLGTATRPIFIAISTQDESTAIDTAYRRYGHGDIVTILHDSDQLDTSAVSRAVWHFNTQENLMKLNGRSQFSTHYSIQGLLWAYLHALGFLWRKLLNSFEYATNTTGVSFYQSEIFLSRQLHTPTKTYFAEDVVVRPSATLISRELIVGMYNRRRQQFELLGSHGYISTPYTARNIPTAALRLLLFLCSSYLVLALPILLTYCIILALAAHQPLLLFAALSATSICLLLGLWSDKTSSLSQKIRLSLLVPISFLPLYSMAWIHSLITMAATIHAIWMYLVKRVFKQRAVAR